MNTNEHRIREYAYQIWESEGKPHGQCERHWSMACTLAQTQMESELAANDSAQQMASTEPIEPISPTQPAQPVTPSDPIQPTDPVQPAQPVQPASPSAQFAEGPAAEAAVKKPGTKKVNVDEVIARVATNEKAAARKKSAGKGELNTDVKIKTDMRKTDAASTSKKTENTETKKTAKPRKTKAVENELS
ncbi:MAG: DUF2934 domain-containing protein [Gammaproteobacteria bacterium]|nr:MAG: DUF2934 domain-containing protein [Gammaproteobacteria bacterium]